MASWQRELAEAKSIPTVVQVAHEFVALMRPAIKHKIGYLGLFGGIADERDVHRWHITLSRAYPTSVMADLDPDIQYVCAFFLAASARCFDLSRPSSGSNDASYALRLQEYVDALGLPLRKPSRSSRG